MKVIELFSQWPEDLVNLLLILLRECLSVLLHYRSRQDLEGLKAEKRVIDSEVETLSGAFEQAAAALRDLRRLYDEGQLRIPIDGVVSRVVAEFPCASFAVSVYVPCPTLRGRFKCAENEPFASTTAVA